MYISKISRLIQFSSPNTEERKGLVFFKTCS